MKVAVIFIIVAPGLSLQDHHHHRSESCSSELSESRQSREYDYDQKPHYRKSSRKHRHKEYTSKENDHVESAELEASNNKYVKHERHSHRRSKSYPKRHSNTYSDNCVCDCQKCEEIQTCCQQVCTKECEQQEPEQGNQVEQPGLSPGNLVFVPYPYPLVVPPPIPPLMPPVPVPSIDPPTPTPTAAPSTTSTAPSLSNLATPNARKIIDAGNENYLDLLRSLKHRKELSIDQLSGTRPVKRYSPEYGMISDRLIDQLISQVRNVKDINSTV